MHVQINNVKLVSVANVDSRLLKLYVTILRFYKIVESEPSALRCFSRASDVYSLTYIPDHDLINLNTMFLNR